MISFECDYLAGAHPEILRRLMETNLVSQPGYGNDIYTESAKAKIKEVCQCPEGEVWLLTGGTQTNQFVISSLLAPFEGVVAATTGHVNVHEAGAIEYTGHKVLTLPATEGKICGADLKAMLETFYADPTYTHMVIPGMVYISYPTEYGTLYSKQELTEIYEICRTYDMPLFVDGARLGYGLAGNGGDLTMPELATLCDVFYIGGTKVGALCGEAVVFTGRYVPKYLLTQVKQHGALLAKGRLNGVQFDALFTDDLYMTISRHAIDMAKKLKEMFLEKGYELFLDSPTNQQFIILENGKMAELEKQVGFSFWEPFDEDHTVVRFATSWATTEADLEYLGALI